MSALFDSRPLISVLGQDGCTNKLADMEHTVTSLLTDVADYVTSGRFIALSSPQLPFLQCTHLLSTLPDCQIC
jgi:hypothetical protein